MTAVAGVFFGLVIALGLFLMGKSLYEIGRCTERLRVLDRVFKHIQPKAGDPDFFVKAAVYDAAWSRFVEMRKP